MGNGYFTRIELFSEETCNEKQTSHSNGLIKFIKFLLIEFTVSLPRAFKSINMMNPILTFGQYFVMKSKV